MLDMLCDGVEAEEAADKRKQLVASKNKMMDEKLNKIKENKQMIKVQQLERSMHTEGKDEKSGILLRKNSRCATEDEIMAKATCHRDFLPIEKMDDVNMRTKYLS